MQRVRRAATVAPLLVVALCLSSLPAAAIPMGATVALAASVPWPPSTIVVSEVQTGGSSASDEFVEIANQGAGPVDLVGLELVYSTSSGSTVTRKATWTTSTILASGQRILIVNGAGSFVGLGDGAYTGGFAATGGAVALRVVGGMVVDSVGWGDATNAFVEGTVAPAPPASSSLERRPGGPAGNASDTNDNAIDWFLSASPGPQNLGSPLVPSPGVTPSPTATASAEPTVTPTPEPTSTPTGSPESTPSPTTEPTASPTVAPTPPPTPTPEPTPSTVSIADARGQPDGAVVTIAGVLTTDLGALEAGHGAFVQDDSGGVAIYLDAAVVASLVAGTSVVVHGSVDDRFAQRTVRASEADIVATGTVPLPAPFTSSTGAAIEPVEGRRLLVTGDVTSGPDSLADGTAVTVDDGSGATRVIVTPGALAGRQLDVGSRIIAVGPLGQRDSSGTGVAGYRLFVTAVSDLVVEPPPTATPSAAPTPSQTPTPTPGPTGSPLPTPTASPTPAPSPTPATPSIAGVRGQAIGSTASVRGVVTAEVGRLGTAGLLAIADTSGGIIVKLPSGATPPARGRVVSVSGKLADPYGQIEIRPAASGITFEGTAALPAPIDVPAAGPNESTEGRVVRLTGVVVERPTKVDSGDIRVLIETASGTKVRIMADASSGLRPTSFVKGARYRMVGIAGQRATAKGALDGYRVWLRDRHDLTLLAAAPKPSPSAGQPGASNGPRPSVVSIATALRITDRDIAIDAVVTAGAKLLDSSGRRIVVQDATGAIEILIPKDTSAPSVGSRTRVAGRVGTAYGAPRLRAETLERRGSAAVPAPLRVNGPLTTAHTWRLVSIAGRVDDVSKLGERWRAEIVVGATKLVVVAQPGARIPSTALAEGRVADIVGIARPAYPSASDKRPSILPRSTADVRQRGVAPSSSPGTVSNTRTGAPTGPAARASDTVQADLVDLASLLGSVVRVGGLVVDLRSDGFMLDDGTAVGRVVLTGAASDWVGLVEPDDAINATGRVEEQVDGEPALVVDDPSALTLGSALDRLDATADPEPSPSPTLGSHADVRTAGFADPGALVPGAGAGLAGLLVVGLASVAMTVLRRRKGKRLLAERVTTRLARLTGSAGPDRGERATSLGVRRRD